MQVLRLDLQYAGRPGGRLPSRLLYHESQRIGFVQQLTTNDLQSQKWRRFRQADQIDPTDAKRIF